MEDADNFGQLIAELKEQNAKILEENAELIKQNGKLIEENIKLKNRIDKLTTAEVNAELKRKRPAVLAPEFDVSPRQMKQMKISNEPESSDFEATIGEKSTTKPKSVLNPNCLHDVLAWIKRKEMADSALSTSSRTLQQFCWPKLHGNVKPKIVESLAFSEYYDEFGNLRVELKCDLIPIASIPPPNYITGFRQIQICFLNGQIMRFMESIYPILNQFYLEFDFNSTPFYFLTSQSIGQIHHLSETLVNKAIALDVPCIYGFLRFQPNANAIIENIQLISTELNKKNIDLLFNWVTTTRADHRPKMLKLINYGRNLLGTFIDQIKKEFSDGAHIKNFIILQLPLSIEEEEVEEEMDVEEYPEFILENEQTNEVLSYYADNYGCKFLVRFPKGNEHLWEKQIYEMRTQSQRILITIWEIGEF